MREWPRGCAVLVVLIAALVGAHVLTPRAGRQNETRFLERELPRQFGPWSEQPDPLIQVQAAIPAGPDRAGAERAAYDQVLTRTYARADGRRIMVTLAYGRAQTQELKIHRPELCYTAQGFAVRPLGARTLRFATDSAIAATALRAQNRSRLEVVTYWIRIGDRVTSGAWSMRWALLQLGLAGRIPDGLLVRASSLAVSEADIDGELALQTGFLQEFYRAAAPGTRKWLTGA